MVHTFLNTIFKLFSRSVVIAGLLYIAGNTAFAQVSNLPWTQIQSCAQGTLAAATEVSPTCQEIKKADTFSKLAICNESVSVEQFGLVSTYLSYFTPFKPNETKFTLSDKYVAKCKQSTETIRQCLSDESYFNRQTETCNEIIPQGEDLLAEYRSELKSLQDAASQNREDNIARAETASGAAGNVQACFPKLMGGSGFVLTDCIVGLMDASIVAIAASFLQLCAYIFEFSIQVSIVKFSSIVTAGGDWLTVIWSTIRDILNIGVIFVLLYAAINIIVGRGGEIKKLIAGVILFGVLTNFSLFLTKAAVDISNVIALEFYQQMRTLPLSDTSFSGGLGASIVSITKLRNLYDPNPGSAGISNEVTQKVTGNGILFRLAMIAVFVAVGLIFLQAAGLFIGRTLTIIFLLIFSPLMFAGAIFSPLEAYITQWRKEFISQVTVAPVFMITLYVVLTVMESLVNSVINISNDGDTFTFLSLTLLTSALIIFGFGIAINQAKKHAGTFGGKVSSWAGTLGTGLINRTAGRATGAILGGTSGMLAKVGQNTLGRIPGLKNFSYDVRNTKAVEKVGSGVSKALAAASGGSLTGLQVNTGTGFKPRTERLKDDAEKAKIASEAIQKKADAEIADTFKKMDDNTKQYTVFDTEVVTGLNTSIERTTQTNAEWEKIVNGANTYRKNQTLAAKTDYLASRSVVNKPTSKIKSAAGRAEFKAVKAQQKKLSSEQKAATDNKVRKDKLKAYKDDLKTQFASNANARPTPPLSAVGVQLTQEQIEAMSDEEIADVWNQVRDEAKIEFQTFKTNAATQLNNPNDPGYRSAQMHKNSFEALIKRAEDAKKNMSALQKSIEDYEKK